ncbi:MAG TPA: fluoride efflux transporter CrcB [Cryptosporangiaceae bacterium]|nr:fluoride efflux transporter CrcB [Cryptosporangiaceae bacterium]
MSWLLVGLGAALGAPARYLVDRAIQTRFGSAFPWGTIVVNVLGSCVLGFVAGAAAALPAEVAILLGAGFAGAFTTYSTFGYETVQLLSRGSRRLAVANVLLSVLACLASAAISLWIGAG